MIYSGMSISLQWLQKLKLIRSNSPLQPALTHFVMFRTDFDKLRAIGFSFHLFVCLPFVVSLSNYERKIGTNQDIEWNIVIGNYTYWEKKAEQ